MDPVSAIGIASAVLQFLDVGWKVAKKLAEYNATADNDIPRSLQNINAQLPLLLDALSRVKTDKEISNFGVDTRCILRGVVSGCTKLVEETQEIVTKAAKQPGESVGIKLKKVLGGLKQEQRITAIDRSLQTYIQVLVLHHVVDDSAAQPISNLEDSYFVVKEKPADPFYERQELMTQLDEAFFDVARGLTEAPTYVVLQGEQGAGKSQLALQFINQAHESGQFPSVFWLYASSPEVLRSSLEGAAAHIRRSTAGSSHEKLTYIDGFLKERWHPWLLVIDGYSHKSYERDAMKKILPDRGNGAILITTREQGSTAVGSVIRVNKFLTSDELEDLRYEMTRAIEAKDIQKLSKGLAKGISANQTETSSNWPFVIRAALYGFDAGVELLLSCGADASIPYYGWSALVAAAGNGHLHVVNRLLDHEDLTDRRLAKEEYEKAALKAIEDGYARVVEVLVFRRNVDLRVKDRYGRIGILKATSGNHFEVVKLLCSAGAGPVSDQEKGTCIANAVNKGNLEMTKFFLNDVRVNPDSRDEYGKPILCLAASLYPRDVGRTDGSGERTIELLVEMLLSASADPNAMITRTGKTPLHEAAFRQYSNVVSTLLMHGACPEIKDWDELTPVIAAAKRNHPAIVKMLLEATIDDPSKREEYFNGVLHYAAGNGDRDLVLLVLKIENGANLDSKNPKGSTALVAAIEGKYMQVARLLVRHGADPSIHASDGSFAVHKAAAAGLDLVLRDLVRAKKTLYLDVKDSNENTALIVAAQAGHEQCVKVLLDAGADKEELNKYGETALDVAEEKKFDKVLRLLEGLPLQEGSGSTQG